MADSEKLNYGYLGNLSNAHHDGTTQQIDDCAGNYETDNQTFIQKATAVHQRRVHEDEVWLKSQVDPNVKLLEGADRGQDKYMSCFNGIVSGYAALPETEPQQSLARQSKQVLKDFNFSIHDSYGAEADKILQMGQNLQPLQAFLTEIGAWQWYLKAAEQAQLVNQYLLERAKTKGQFVKGEMKAARRQTDLAIADLYKTINAMMELMPSAELTALYTQLKGLERYARQYYLNDTPGGGDEPTPVTPDNQSGQPETGGNTGTVTPVQPETGGGEGSSTGEGPQPGGDDLGNGDEN